MMLASGAAPAVPQPFFHSVPSESPAVVPGFLTFGDLS
jgi:hypothetical protein